MKLLAPAPAEPTLARTYNVIDRHGVETLSFGGVVVPDAAAMLGDIGTRYPEFLTLVSTAVACDADMVVTGRPGEDVVFDDDLFRRFFMVFGGFDLALGLCEVFVRGHEVPWSFRLPMWNCTWTPFYAMTEPPVRLVTLYNKAQEVSLDRLTIERLRSLAFNRHAGLCYTRDKLLSYRVQRRAAQRHKLERQNFAFELGYFLNHYYLLLWAGLDHVCRIVNTIFGLGVTKKDLRWASPLNKRFLKALSDRAPVLLPAFEDPDFVYWAKMLRGARHWVAHEGFAMPAAVFLRSETEPTEAELDREIENSDEWLKLKELEWLVPGQLESFRPLLRFKAKLQRYRAVPEPMLKVEIDGEACLITPLLNIQWDFDSFFRFANRIADAAMTRLMEPEATPSS